MRPGRIKEQTILYLDWDGDKLKQVIFVVGGRKSAGVGSSEDIPGWIAGRVI